jgi:Ser/Thr protein kinase RdoA (MazF antagonist)
MPIRTTPIRPGALAAALKIVAEAGVRTPRALAVVEVEGRRGIVFEWAGDADLMNAKLQNPLNVASSARFMAEVQREYLRCEAPELPDIKQEAIRMSRELPEGTVRPEQLPKLERYLSRLPDGDQVCHMDFHPGNVLLESGHYDAYQVIDWAEAVKGAPEADVAMTSLILSMAEEAPGTNLLLRVLIPMFRRMFERHYKADVLKSFDAMTAERVSDWTLVAAIFRMHMWKLESEYRFLADLIQKELQAS